MCPPKRVNLRAYRCETPDGHPYDVLEVTDDTYGGDEWWFDGVTGQQVAMSHYSDSETYCCGSTTRYVFGVIPSDCLYAETLDVACL